MLDIIASLPIIFAIVNASIPFGDSFVPVPLEVQPLGSAPAAQAPAPASTGPVDFTGLTGLVTAIGGVLGAIGVKMYKDNKKEDTRDNLMAETALRQTLSLQETDKADYIFKEAVVDYITNPDETKKQKLIQLAQQSKQNYNAYYENIQPQPLDYHKDNVVRKLSAVQKRTEPKQ